MICKFLNIPPQSLDRGGFGGWNLMLTQLMVSNFLGEFIQMQREARNLLCFRLTQITSDLSVPTDLNEYVLWRSMADDMMCEIGGRLPFSSFRVEFSCVSLDVKVILLRTYRKLKRDWFTWSCQLCSEYGLLYAANLQIAGKLGFAECLRLAQCRICYPCLCCRRPNLCHLLVRRWRPYHRHIYFCGLKKSPQPSLHAISRFWRKVVLPKSIDKSS